METLATADQQAIWRICVDPHLEEKILDLISDRTPIFGTGSIMGRLDKEFESRYPLTTHRACTEKKENHSPTM